MVPAHVKTELAVVLPYCKGMVDAGMGEEVEEDLRLALGRDWDPELLRLYSGIEMADAARQLLGAEDWLGPHRDDAQLLHVLGRFALRAAQSEKATAYLQQSLTLEPTMEACKLLGDLLYDRKEDGAAGVLYRQGLKLAAKEPLDVAALTQAASILVQSPAQAIIPQ
jgi:HemY protein